MIINDSIIRKIFAWPPIYSLKEYNSDFFLELADLFGIDVDPDWKMSDVILKTLHSYPGKALRKVFFHCETPHDIHYYSCYTEEIYILCIVLGLGEQPNKVIASKLLSEHINKIRNGFQVELKPLRNQNLINRLDRIYYGKKIQVRPKRKGELLPS